MTDAELLNQFRDLNSAAAFSELMGRHSGWVYALARRRVGDEHLASDVAQAVFILLTERAQQIRDPNRLAAWLQRTTIFASNHAIRHRQRSRVREQAAAAQRAEGDATADPAVALIRSTEIQAVEDTVARLSPADRSLIIHRFYRGQSFAEVGSELGISVDAVRKRVDRALERMKHRLKARGISANALAGILAGLSSMNKIGPSNAGRIVPPIRASATSRAASIAKGVRHMQMINRIKGVTAGAVVMLTLGAGLIMARGNDQGSTTKPAQTVKADQRPSDRRIQSAGVIVVVAADRTKLTGYSILSGASAAVSVTNADVNHVIVANDVAIYSDAEHVYGFSSKTGRWSTIDLPRPFDAASFIGPIVAPEMAAVAVPGSVFAFSADAGTWDTLHVPAEEKVIPAVDAMVITVDADNKVYIFGKNGKWSDGL